jgi:hypothetical protein
LPAAMRMTIINDWRAGGHFAPGANLRRWESDEYLPAWKPLRRYTPDLRSVASLESQPC